jgi:hydrogenase expression/formation protein HypD
MNEKELIKQHINDITNLANEIKREITIMEICGGHTNVIMKYGIRELLPKNINLISGPGCPVCVSSQKDIDNIIELAKSNIPIATYGDMMQVPGSITTLENIRSQNKNIFEIYSVSEVIKLKEKYNNIIFFGVGFETTSPMTAYLLENNITVYSVHKLVPPAIKALIKNNTKIDGFIDPGHVSTIIGSSAYKDIKIPQTISGFKIEQILRSIKYLLELIKDNKNTTINAYIEAVTEEGNTKAKQLLDKHFYINDSEWRGLGIIENSGLEIKDDKKNAKIIYKNILDKVKTTYNTKCICSEILLGTKKPNECPLYKKICNPSNPKGACMVSKEGSCSIYYRYEQ